MTTHPDGTLNHPELVRRLVKSLVNVPCKPGRNHGVSLWYRVSEVLAVGSTVAARVCRELGFDPDQKVRGSW
jgi:hypothetical protein